jgi:hypothetical protein
MLMPCSNKRDSKGCVDGFRWDFIFVRHYGAYMHMRTYMHICTYTKSQNM